MLEIESGDELSLCRRGHKELDMCDSVCRRGAQILVGYFREIDRFAQDAHDAKKRAQERFEIFAMEGRGRIARRFYAVAPADPSVGLRRDSALEVDVKLGFGQRADPVSGNAAHGMKERR